MLWMRRQDIFKKNDVENMKNEAPRLRLGAQKDSKLMTFLKYENREQTMRIAANPSLEGVRNPRKNKSQK